MENGFHLLLQMNKYKLFRLTFQTLHSLTKLHLPNPSSNVDPAHAHSMLPWTLVPLASLPKGVAPQSLQIQILAILPAPFSILAAWKTVTINSKQKCTILPSKGQSTPVFLPGESQGQGSLAGQSTGSQKVRHDWVTHSHPCVSLFGTEGKDEWLKPDKSEDSSAVHLFGLRQVASFCSVSIFNSLKWGRDPLSRGFW